MNEIEVYAVARQIEPATVLQYAAGYGGTAWKKWKRGGTCTMEVAARIRAYIKANPVSSSGAT